MIGERFNFEDVFFRDLTVCVLDTLEGEVRWVNKFSSGDRVVNVPFYYSLTGDERFLLDSFTDDVVSNSRYVDLNTDIIPRGHLTLTSYEIRGDEFANPNVWLKMVVENETEIRNMLTKVRAIPITVKYDLVILLSSEIDTFKCSQAIMDTLWLYRFMYFEHNFMNIDAVMQIPDSNNIEINREKNLTSDNNIKLTVSFDVQTYYPAYRKPKLPDILPYNISTTPYFNKTLSVRVDLFKQKQKIPNETVATSTIILIGDVLTGTPIDVYSDYPVPNTPVIQNFFFTTVNSTQQAEELSNYIKNQTQYSSRFSGTNVKVIAPIGSGELINKKDLVVVGAGNQIITTPFVGGSFFDENLANASITILNIVSINNPLNIKCDYPSLDSHLVDGFTFSSQTVDQQALELSNYINNTTDFTAKVTDNIIKVIAPSGSGSLPNKIDLVVSGPINDVKTTPFGGGSEFTSDEIDIIYSEKHLMTTSSDGSLVIPVGAGLAITGNYLNINLKQNGLKINVSVDTNKEDDYTPLVIGQDLTPSFSNEENDINNINQLFSNSFSVPTDNGDFRDIITLPKRTRWYNNLKNTRGGGSSIKTPYSSQDLNNQKKI